jgi:hypothetical protein
MYISFGNFLFCLMPEIPITIVTDSHIKSIKSFLKEQMIDSLFHSKPLYRTPFKQMINQALTKRGVLLPLRRLKGDLIPLVGNTFNCVNHILPLKEPFTRNKFIHNNPKRPHIHPLIIALAIEHFRRLIN